MTNNENAYPFAPGYAAKSETSKKAAASITQGAYAMSEWIFLLIKASGHKGMTYFEVSAIINASGGTVHHRASSRMTELFKAGRIVLTGERVNPDSKRACGVYVVTVE